MMLDLYGTTVHVQHVLQYGCCWTAPDFTTAFTAYVWGGPHKFLNMQNLMISQQTVLHQHSVQCLHSYDTKKRSFPLGQICSRQQKFGMGDCSPDSAETPYREIFMQCSITINIRGSLSCNTSKVCKTALGTILHHYQSSTVHKWYKEFQFSRTTVEERPLASLWSLLLNKTWQRWSVWSKKTQESQKMR